MCVCPCSCQGRQCPREVVCFLLWVFVRQTLDMSCQRVCVCVCTSVRFAACLFLSEPSCLCTWFSHREGTAVAVHYRERDRGRLEFSGVCLRLGPLLNEEFSILLIMLLWLMSLSADSGECNKTLLLFGLFLPFLIGLNKRAFPASSVVIHILGSGWHLCVCGAFFHVCIGSDVGKFRYLRVVLFLASNLRAVLLFSLMAFIHMPAVLTDALSLPQCGVFFVHLVVMRAFDNWV